MTLLLAVVSVGGWVRSLSYSDTITVSAGKHTTARLTSAVQLMALEIEYDESSELIGMGPSWIQAPLTGTPSWCDERDIYWHLCLCGVRYGEIYYFPSGSYRDTPLHSLRIWCVQYWLFVVPLTVGSACLLLYKPVKTPTVNEST